MTFEDIKKEIKGLGFSDADTMTEYEQEDILIPAINRAINVINTSVRPIIGTVEVVKTTDEYETYNMNELVEDFVDFYEKPKIKTESDFLFLNDYFIEENKKISLRANEGVTVTIHYIKFPTQITLDTESTFEVELDKLVQPLIPVLASYFIWLDDEPTKATMYYNTYDDMKTQILSATKRPVPVAFRGGVKWGR